MLLVAIVFVFVLPGVEGLTYDDRVEEHVGEVPDPYEQVPDLAAPLGVSQPQWSVFAPTPRTTDRYYVFPARTADGEYLDVYNDRELTYDRPYDELQLQYGTYRERFYMNSVRLDGYVGGTPPELAAYYCTEWAAERGVELTHVNTYVVLEDVTRDTVDDPSGRERSTRKIYSHGCGDNVADEFGRPDF